MTSEPLQFTPSKTPGERLSECYSETIAIVYASHESGYKTKLSFQIFMGLKEKEKSIHVFLNLVWHCPACFNLDALTLIIFCLLN